MAYGSRPYQTPGELEIKYLPQNLGKTNITEHILSQV